MKITDTIHAVKHPFQLKLSEGRSVDRFVYSYLLLGKKICLIDAGVARTAPMLLDYIEKLGRSPEEISMILLTHSHPDHIGGCPVFKKASSASLAVHPAERSWVEDVDRQHRERTTPTFYDLVGGSTPVDLELREGRTVFWDEGKGLKVFETPGHSSGSVSFFEEQEGALFTGDAVPETGAIPIYVDPAALVASIRKLQKIPGVRYLFSSWHEPMSGDRAASVMEESIRYIARIDRIVKDLNAGSPGMPIDELSRRALDALGIRLPQVFPLVTASFEAHRRGTPISG